MIADTLNEPVRLGGPGGPPEVPRDRAGGKSVAPDDKSTYRAVAAPA
jgi:hypothetical protein